MSAPLKSPPSPSTTDAADESDVRLRLVCGADPAKRLEMLETFLAAVELRIEFPSALSELEVVVLLGALRMVATHLDLSAEGEAGRALVESFPERFDRVAERHGHALDQLKADGWCLGLPKHLGADVPARFFKADGV